MFIKSGSTMICVRNFVPSHDYVIFNTPKGITVETFSEKIETFQTWQKRKHKSYENPLSFSCGDEIEILDIEPPNDDGDIMVRIVQTKKNPVERDERIYKRMHLTHEEVFFSMEREDLEYFVRKEKIPQKKAFQEEVLLQEYEYHLQHQISYVRNLNAHVFEYQISQLYVENDSYTHHNMSEEMIRSIEAFCSLHFEEQIIVHPCAVKGYRWNPDRVAVRVFVFITPKEKLTEAISSLNTKKEDFSEITNYHPLAWDKERYIKSLKKDFLQAKKEIEQSKEYIHMKKLQTLREKKQNGELPWLKK